MAAPVVWVAKPNPVGVLGRRGGCYSLQETPKVEPLKPKLTLAVVFEIGVIKAGSTNIVLTKKTKLMVVISSLATNSLFPVRVTISFLQIAAHHCLSLVRMRKINLVLMNTKARLRWVMVPATVTVKIYTLTMKLVPVTHLTVRSSVVLHKTKKPALFFV